MLCTLSFSSNAIFHTCDDNLKMRQNFPAETIQIGVTEVSSQVQQTYIFNQSRFPRLFTTTGTSITCRNSGNCGLLRQQNFKPNQHKDIHLVLEGLSRETFPTLIFFRDFYHLKLMSYLCQKCKKIGGHQLHLGVNKPEGSPQI